MPHKFLHQFSTTNGHCVKVTKASEHIYFVSVEAAGGDTIEFEWEESTFLGNIVKPAFTGTLKDIQDEVVVALEQLVCG
ncbi:MAG: hypothetical protein QM802_20905 [Agriterribacter sp.]